MKTISMRNKLLFIPAIILLINCNKKDQLNYIDFKVSKNTMIDSLNTATVILDQMDLTGYGNGAACFVVDGQLHYSGREKGFAIVEMPKENSSSVPIIEPLDQANSKRLFDLITFLNKNGIDGMAKRWDGIFFFGYKQHDFNPSNDYKQSRSIVLTKGPKDNRSSYFRDLVILDRYKSILLMAPNTYNEPKLPMDSASIMNRAKEISKKQGKVVN